MVSLTPTPVSCFRLDISPVTWRLGPAVAGVSEPLLVKACEPRFAQVRVMQRESAKLRVRGVGSTPQLAHRFPGLSEPQLLHL